MKTLDTRDLKERKEELEALRDAVTDAQSELDQHRDGKPSEEEEEFAFNEEQERISKEYEKREHPTQRGVAELLNGETTFRKPE